MLLVLGCAALGILGPSTTAHAATSKSPTYYVSLGDSYSVGYQPGFGATPGYTVYVAGRTHLKLVNFGCAGATTTSLIASVGCPDPLPHTTGAAPYPTMTQAAAAEAFLTAHHGHIGLITVTIGGNDVIPCRRQANVVNCVGTTVSGVSKNVTALRRRLACRGGTPCPTHRPHLSRRHPRNLRLPVATAQYIARLTGQTLRGRVQGPHQPHARPRRIRPPAEAWWTSPLRRAPTRR